MDNTSFHQRHDMLEAISANQCKAEFLPPDSPDLNPIEDKWVQAKAVRRRYQYGIDELFSEHSQYVFYNDLANTANPSAIIGGSCSLDLTVCHS